MKLPSSSRSALSMCRRPAITWLGLLLSVVGATSLPTAWAASNEQQQYQLGKQIFKQQCASCHGDRGQGSPDSYSEPLEGDSTVGELAELIDLTMPEEAPEECVDDDARAVAAFMHREFYSPSAQQRRQPAPQVSLARLTGEQLRQSLADLAAAFSPHWSIGDQYGLQGRYFNSKKQWRTKKVFERVDPQIIFDFGYDGPGQKVQPDSFIIDWRGAIIAPETGRYQFVVDSTCAFVLRVASQERTLIDNLVQSEGQDQLRQSIFLTGGRAYSFQLELHQRKRKSNQPPAKVTLSWIPPGGVEEPIPAQYLRPVAPPPTFALQAKLPPDDRSYGYDRGIAVNRAWDEAVTRSALEFAEIAATEFYPQFRNQRKKESDENRRLLRTFLDRLVATAFRRPLDDAMREYFVDRFVDQYDNDADAIKLATLLTIKSPRFLYPSLDSDRNLSRRTGSRLALTLFDSLPSDGRLGQRIHKDSLSTEQQIRSAAVHMVGDRRCQAKIKRFLYEWWDLGDAAEMTKASELFPGFDASLVAQLRQSFDRFIETVVQSESSDFRQLLQADWSYTSPQLADFYGPAWRPRDAQESAGGQLADRFGRSVSDANRHVGVLAHPFLLSHLAYHRTSSPIHRGVFLTRKTLGRVLRPPSEAFAPLNPEVHPGLTTRQRVELQTGEANCQVCHVKINAVGFVLEQFDAAGRFRDSENGKPIDASGSYVSLAGDRVEFDGARELGDYLAGSQDCQRSFVDSAFEYFVKQPIAAYGPNTSDRLLQSFQQHGFHIRHLISEIAVTAALPRPETNRASAAISSVSKNTTTSR